MSFLETFTALPRPSTPGAYTVEHGTRRFRVGRSHENHPALLIEFSETAAASIPRRLANLAYSPPTEVELKSPGDAPHRARLAILECRSVDPAVSDYFFRIAAAILVDNPTTSDPKGFEGAIDAVVTLFRSLSRGGHKTIQGLWTELAVILWSASPEATLSSWHSSPRALYDFAAGNERLEVKSSLRGLREHQFSLEQLATTQPGATLVASILLSEAEDGLSAFDLVRAIGDRVKSEARARLEAIVADSLGSSWREATDLRFSLDEAWRSLQVFSVETIPTISASLPPEIKDVRFAVDLSSTPPLDLRHARSLGAFFAQVLPSSTPDETTVRPGR